MVESDSATLQSSWCARGAELVYGSARGDEEKRGGEVKKHLWGLLFFNTSFGSLGVIPSFNIFAKETVLPMSFSTQ